MEKEKAIENIIAKGGTILNVAFMRRAIAKAAGAKFDGTAKTWYAPKNADLDKLKQFLPTNERIKIDAKAVLDYRGGVYYQFRDIDIDGKRLGFEIMYDRAGKNTQRSYRLKISPELHGNTFEYHGKEIDDFYNVDSINFDTPEEMIRFYDTYKTEIDTEYNRQIEEKLSAAEKDEQVVSVKNTDNILSPINTRISFYKKLLGKDGKETLESALGDIVKPNVKGFEDALFAVEKDYELWHITETQTGMRTMPGDRSFKTKKEALSWLNEALEKVEKNKVIKVNGKTFNKTAIDDFKSELKIKNNKIKKCRR